MLPELPALPHVRGQRVVYMRWREVGHLHQDVQLHHELGPDPAVCGQAGEQAGVLVHHDGRNAEADLEKKQKN